MTKKKIIIIILIVFALALVAVGVVLSVRKSKDYKLSPTPVKKNYYTMDDAIEISHMYESEETKVEVLESEDGNYSITVKDKLTGDVKNTFSVNKKTGVVSEVPTSSTSYTVVVGNE